MINTELIELKIKESGKKKCYLAKKCGLSYKSFSNCVGNRAEFKSEHIKILCDELAIVTLKDREEIFFATTVP